jgi:hypothetical protein
MHTVATALIGAEFQWCLNVVSSWARPPGNKDDAGLRQQHSGVQSILTTHNVIFGRLDSSSSSSSGIYSYACSLVHSELSLVGTQKLFAFTCRTHALWQSLQL